MSTITSMEMCSNPEKRMKSNQMTIRVGIITLPGRFNYGNRLQNYATARILERIGLNTKSLELVRPKLVAQGVLLAKRVLGRPLPPEESMGRERLAAFDRFNTRIDTRAVTRLGVGSLKGHYDLFVAGSDQVWNPNFIARRSWWYFLEFAERTQRIALSPSIGLDTLDAEQASMVAKGVSGFDCLSVRESRGAELIKECSNRDATVICDPTLVLPPEEWRAVSDDRLTPAEPYVFTYLLGGVGAGAARILDEVTDHGRLPVVPLSDRQKPEEPDAGPADFISLIDNAAHVVTDSFHAAVFSSILQTPLTIVRREGGASMFSRLETLAQTLGIEHKVHGSPDFDLSRAGDYKGAPEAIERERRKFMDYLEGCLDAQLPGWRGGARA